MHYLGIIHTLVRLLPGFSGVEHVRIVRDRGSGQSRGFGFVVRTLAWHVQGYFADDTQQAGHTYGKMARPMRVSTVSHGISHD